MSGFSDSAPVLRLFLVRHGQVASNREFRYVGRGGNDEPLTEDGELQAEALGEAMAEIAPTLLLCSPLRRTLQTADRIARTCGLDCRREPRLIEQSFGDWEGRTRDEVRALGEAHATQLGRCDRDPSCAPPGGESLADVQRRVVSLVEELAIEHPGETAVLVSHVGPIKTLLAAAMGLGIPDVRRWFLDPGTISVVDWSSAPTLRLFNAHAQRGWRSARWIRDWR